MRYLILALMLLAAGCDRAPVSLIYSNIPSDYSIAADERAVVEASLGTFLGLEPAPNTQQVKTLKYEAGRVKVCGLIGHDRLFAGYLLGAPGSQRFDVVTVTDISNPDAIGGIDIVRLCRA